MNKFNNLEFTLSVFYEKLDLDREQNLSSLKFALNNGHIDLDNLKKEYLSAVMDSNFDWRAISKNSMLIIDSDRYSYSEITAYVQYLIHEFLFPKNKFSNETLKELINDCAIILNKVEPNNSWLDSNELWKALKSMPKYSELMYFQLYHVWPNSNYKIERKFIQNKPILIGFLRLKSYASDELQL